VLKGLILYPYVWIQCYYSLTKNVTPINIQGIWCIVSLYMHGTNHLFVFIHANLFQSTFPFIFLHWMVLEVNFNINKVFCKLFDNFHDNIMGFSNMQFFFRRNFHLYPHHFYEGFVMEWKIVHTLFRHILLFKLHVHQHIMTYSMFLSQHRLFASSTRLLHFCP
jgi:hypothetical protein